jgi:hypothetical protein
MGSVRHPVQHDPPRRISTAPLRGGLSTRGLAAALYKADALPTDVPISPHILVSCRPRAAGVPARAATFSHLGALPCRRRNLIGAGFHLAGFGISTNYPRVFSYKVRGRFNCEIWTCLHLPPLPGPTARRPASSHRATPVRDLSAPMWRPGPIHCRAGLIVSSSSGLSNRTVTGRPPYILSAPACGLN